MPLGIDIPDLGLGDVGSIMGMVGQIVGIIILFGISAIILFFVLKSFKNKKYFNKKIFWFEEVHGEMIPVGDDIAKELTIPGTNIKVFYIKKKDMYMPRLTIRMGKNAYWLCIKNNREIVNFKMKDLNVEMKEAGLDFDHTDMRYAMANLEELIKRNYRDKAIPWWREYKEIIALIILVFVMTMSFIFILMQVGKLINQVGSLIGSADQVVQSVKLLKDSGILMK